MQNIQLLFCRRQVGIFDFTLSGEERRQMRIVEYAQTIGVELGHFLQRKGKTLRRLFRQAVNQIDIRRGKTNLTRVVEQGKDKRLILLAVNQPLNLFIEVLHAHAQPVEAFRSEMIQDIQFNFARIDFNRDLCIGVKIEMAAQQMH